MGKRTPRSPSLDRGTPRLRLKRNYLMLANNDFHPLISGTPDVRLKRNYLTFANGDPLLAIRGTPRFLLRPNHVDPHDDDAPDAQQLMQERRKPESSVQEAASSDAGRSSDVAGITSKRSYFGVANDSDKAVARSADPINPFSGSNAGVLDPNSPSSTWKASSERPSGAYAFARVSLDSKGGAASEGDADPVDQGLDRSGENDACAGSTSKVDGAQTSGEAQTDLRSDGSNMKWLVRNHNDASYFNATSALLISRNEIVADLELEVSLTPQAHMYFKHLAVLKCNMDEPNGQPRKMKMTRMP